MQRRLFLQSAILAPFGISALASMALGADSKKPKVAVQLYSVRGAASKDIAAVLAAIAKMGYDGVEFAGYYGKSPKDLKKMLDDNGLVCCGTHTHIGEMRGDKFASTAELHKELGTKYMIVPGGIDKELHSLDGNKAMADEFNKLAEKAAKFDLAVGYHAHGGDAFIVDGIPAWERLFDATEPAVIMQMDLGNYSQGGGDPYKMIEKFAGRSKSVHCKETGRDIIGLGNVDWKKAFELCESVGGTEWYVVEDEHTPDSLDRIDLCRKAMKDMGK
ncbi:MAG: sugar phosphate isomerase/epimerase family protein [Thermoguttaceae bacterium]